MFMFHASGALLHHSRKCITSRLWCGRKLHVSNNVARSFAAIAGRRASAPVPAFASPSWRPLRSKSRVNSAKRAAQCVGASHPASVKRAARARHRSKRLVAGGGRTGALSVNRSLACNRDDESHARSRRSVKAHSAGIAAATSEAAAGLHAPSALRTGPLTPLRDLVAHRYLTQAARPARAPLR